MKLRMKIGAFEFKADGDEQDVMRLYREWRQMLEATHPEVRWPWTPKAIAVGDTWETTRPST